MTQLLEYYNDGDNKERDEKFLLTTLTDSLNNVIAKFDINEEVAKQFHTNMKQSLRKAIHNRQCRRQSCPKPIDQCQKNTCFNNNTILNNVNLQNMEGIPDPYSYTMDDINNAIQMVMKNAQRSFITTEASSCKSDVPIVVTPSRRMFSGNVKDQIMGLFTQKCNFF